MAQETLFCRGGRTKAERWCSSSSVINFADDDADDHVIEYCEKMLFFKKWR